MTQTPDHGRNDGAALPTTGFNPPVGRYDSYADLEQAVAEYRDAADQDMQVERALAAILAEDRRDRFVNSHDLSEPAETACVARLIGSNECPHNVLNQDDDPHAPPHEPPVADHATLWLDGDGEPAVYSMHVYVADLKHNTGDGPSNRWFDLVDFASDYGLEIAVRDSWYNPGSCQQILFYSPTRYS